MSDPITKWHCFISEILLHSSSIVDQFLFEEFIRSKILARHALTSSCVNKFKHISEERSANSNESRNRSASSNVFLHGEAKRWKEGENGLLFTCSFEM